MTQNAELLRIIPLGHRPITLSAPRVMLEHCVSSAVSHIINLLAQQYYVNTNINNGVAAALQQLIWYFDYLAQGPLTIAQM
jgi:hypothetical protein